MEINFQRQCLMLHIRGRLAPSKAEKLIVLRENLALVEDFKANSLYQVQKGEHNAFDGVEMEAVAGEGQESMAGWYAAMGHATDQSRNESRTPLPEPSECKSRG